MESSRKIRIGQLDTSTGLLTGSGITNKFAKFSSNTTLTGSTSMTELPSGFIGIGTTNPLSLLHVSGSVLSNSFVKSGGTSSQFLMADGSVSFGASGSVGGTGTTNFIPKWSGTTGITNSQIFDSGTNVSIGTTDTSFAKLAINSTTAIGLAIGDLTTPTNEAGIYLRTNTKANINWATGGRLAFNSAAGGTERMTILDNGNIGIGISNPQSKLDICGATRTTSLKAIGRIYSINESNFDDLVSTSGSTTMWYDTILQEGFITARNYSLTSDRPMTVGGSKIMLMSGNVLINTNADNGTDKLQVNGSAISSAWKTSGGTSAQYVKGDGTLGPISGLTGSTSSGGIGGGGTTNFVAKWSSTTGLTNSLLFDNGTNVGINIGAPSERLTIQQGNIKLYTLQASNNEYTYIGTEYASGNGNNKAEIRFAIDGSDTKTRIQFHTANGIADISEKMRINANGNVLIGQTSDNTIDKLQVNGSGLFLGKVNIVASEALKMINDNAYLSAFNTANSIRTGYIQFNTSGNSVIMNEANTGWIFGTNASEKMRIDSIGNVGIGTNNPVNYGGYVSLSIGENVAGKIGLIKFKSTYNSGDGAEFSQLPSGDIYIGNSSSNATMVIKPNASVGIGLVSPSAKLDVFAPQDGMGYALSGYPFLKYSVGDVLDYGSFSPTWTALRFLNNGIETMRLTNSNTVGIGTSNPLGKLHIGGVGSTLVFDTTGVNASAIISTVQDYKLSLKCDRGTTSEIRIGNDNLEFFTSGIERLRIDTSGNVGIGTITPINGGNAAKWLTLEGTTSYGGGMATSINGVAQGFFYSWNNYVTMAGTVGKGIKLTVNNAIDAITIPTSGNVLINTTTDNGIDKLQVNGNISAYEAVNQNQVVTKSQLDRKLSNLYLGNPSDYYKTVTLLHKLDNSNIGASYEFNGEVFLRRFNGLYPPIIVEVTSQKIYNGDYAIGHVSIINQQGEVRIVTFNYNGIKWLGVVNFVSDASVGINVNGDWTDTPIVVAYYDNSSATILNNEIYSSLANYSHNGWQSLNGRLRIGGYGSSDSLLDLNAINSGGGVQNLLRIGENASLSTDYGLVLKGNTSTGVFSFHGVNGGSETGPIFSMQRNSGNILMGTGTDNGSYKLQVNGAGYFTGAIAVDTTGGLFNFRSQTPANNYGTFRQNNGDALAYIGDANGSAIGGGAVNDFAIAAPTGKLFLQTNSNLVLNGFGSTGRVLIGTTTDNTIDKLQVNGNIFTSYGSHASIGNYTWIGGSGGDYGSVGYNIGYTQNGGTYNYAVNDTSSIVRFDTGGFRFMGAPSGSAGNPIPYTDLVSFRANGNVLIGTISDNGNKLQVNGSAWINGGIDALGTVYARATEAIRIVNDNGYIAGFNSANTSRNGFLQFSNSSINFQSETGPIIINSGGRNVLIGTATDSGAKLRVLGGITELDQITFYKGIDKGATDLNNLQVGGFYVGSSFTNAPLGDQGWFWVTVEQHVGVGWTHQTATSFEAGGSLATNRIFSRTFTNGSTWSPWLEKVTSGNYLNYRPNKLVSSNPYYGSMIDDNTSAESLCEPGSLTSVAMHNTSANGLNPGGHGTTLTFSGYDRYGATQIQSNYNADASNGKLGYRNFNQFLNTWTPWRTLIDSVNFSSYGLLNYGNGGPAIDVNTLTTTGLYRGSTQNWTNQPPHLDNSNALLHMDTHPGGYYSQLWFDTGNNKLLMRSASAGSYGNWTQIIKENNSGNVLIGTTSDSGNRLRVNGSARIDGAMDVVGTLYGYGNSEAVRFINSGGFVSGYDSANTARTGYLQFNYGANVTLASETGSKSILLNPNGGNVIIGTSTDNGVDKLQVNGSIKAVGSITAGSDQRLKSNIKPLENSLQKVMNVTGFKFDRIDTKTTNQIGFIAQNLEKEFPELVQTETNLYDEGEGLKSVNYQAMVAVLVEAIKEQQTIINDLKLRIERLETN